MTRSITLDTTVIVRGLVPPRRTKKDELYEIHHRLHKKARNILGKVEKGELVNHSPVIALVETAAVISRLTNSRIATEMALSFLEAHTKFYSDVYLLDKAIELGIKTKASGFDVIFIACAQVTGSTLITDDKKMYNKALMAGIPAEILRETGDES